MGPWALAALWVSLATAASSPVKTELPLQDDAAEAARAAMRVIATEYLDAYFRWRPEDGTLLSVQDADGAAVQDPALAALAAWHAAEDGFLSRVRAVDPGALAGSREGEAHRVLREVLNASQATRVCRLELWTVSAANGWQREYATLARNQPIGTPARREAAVARVSALARRLTGEIANLHEGVRLGFVATRDDVAQVVEELDRLLATPPERWPQAIPGDRDEDPAFKAALVAAIQRELAPAAARYRDYLRDEYLGHARQTASLLVLPGGDRCERAWTRLRQVLELEPPDLHASRVSRAQVLRYAVLDVAGVRPAVWVNYGTSLHFAGRYQESVRAYDRALALGFDPDVPVDLVVRNTALALVRLKDYDQARERLEAYLAKASRDAATTVILGLVELDTGHLEAAETAARKALAVDPRLSRGFQILGQVQEKRGDLQGAVDHWDQASRLDPNDPLPPYSIGRAEEQRGHIDAACGSYDRARRAVAWSSAGKSAAAAYDRLCRARERRP
jgi:tetratricopeptide (TPR) repeat protein